MQLHHKALWVTLVWTLGLLFLGSVVHATESSLACPDWPTCFGTMMPEMTGGVFWEHLHRLVAGGLLLIFGAVTWLIWREIPERGWVLRSALFGVFLLLVQSVLGGLTVLMRLPDAISSSHLTLAFLFLGLTAVLTVATSPRWGRRPALPLRGGVRLRRAVTPVAGLVLAQSVVGAVVRHTDAGMACPDVPLCLGRVVPPLEHPLVILHFSHRALGIVVALATLTVAIWLLREFAVPRIRGLAVAAVATVLVQVLLGFLSVAESLAVLPVSLHTLVAALLFAITVALATYGWEPGADVGSGQSETVQLSGALGGGR